MYGRILMVFTMLFEASVALRGQDYRGEVIPSTPARAIASDVAFSRFRFHSFAFGREGPTYAPLRAAPVQGRRYFVEADVFGIEGVADVRFELTDVSGRLLQTLILWKATDSATDGEFHGFAVVPNQTFRLAAAGKLRNGAPYRANLQGMTQPRANGPEDQLVLPSGFSPDQTGRVRQFIAAFEQEMNERSAQAAREHPDGVIPLSRAEVSRIAYEPLLAPTGSAMGMRLRYGVRFATDATVAAVPHVFPVYAATEWRGVVGMKSLGGTITPVPGLPGATSVNDVLLYGGRAQYRAGTTYSFVIDLVPDYVFQGTISGKFCLHEQKYSTNPGPWNALMASNTPVPYTVTVADLDYSGRVPLFFPQSALRASFLAAGALDCGPVPNIRF